MTKCRRRKPCRLERGEARNLERRVKPIGEGGHVLNSYALRLAVAAFGRDSDEPAGRFEREARFGLLHRQNAGVEQNGRDANRVRTGHRRRILGLHDDETHLRPRVLGWHEQIDVPKDPAARLIEEEIAQRPILGDETRLLPQGCARRRWNSADDHVADFALGVASDDMDDFGSAHGRFRFLVWDRAKRAKRQFARERANRPAWRAVVRRRACRALKRWRGSRSDRRSLRPVEQDRRLPLFRGPSGRPLNLRKQQEK